MKETVHYCQSVCERQTPAKTGDAVKRHVAASDNASWHMGHTSNRVP